MPCRSYFRYGLKTATGPTYLAIFRDTIKRYPDRDRRQVLLDLIEMRGEHGKWFAAVKDAGFLDRRPPVRAGVRGRAHDPRARHTGFCCQRAEIRGADWGNRFGARARR